MNTRENKSGLAEKQMSSLVPPGFRMIVTSQYKLQAAKHQYDSTTLI